MSTKTIVIGRKGQQPRKLMPIQFTHIIQAPHPVVGSKTDVIVSNNDCEASPQDFNYIELIAKDYIKGVDVMFAYDHPAMRTKGVLFLGMWNGGSVK